MRCSNCGEPIEEGRLFCLNCGQEVQWVPDYDSFGDYMVQAKLKKEKEQAEAAAARKRAAIAAENRRRKKAKKKRMILVSVAGVLVLVAAGLFFKLGMDKKNYNDFDYQIRMADTAFSNHKYEESYKFVERAVSLDDSDVDAKLLLAQVQVKLEKTDQAIKTLQDAIRLEPDNQSAYNQLIKIYMENDQPDEVKNLLDSCDNDDILNKFSAYISKNPVFSLPEGSYDEPKTLSLYSKEDEDQIYYTTDGTDPTSSSNLYTDSIALKEGQTIIKAVTVNKKGITSDIVSKTYTIAYEAPDPLTSRFCHITSSVSIDILLIAKGTDIVQKHKTGCNLTVIFVNIVDFLQSLTLQTFLLFRSFFPHFFHYHLKERILRVGISFICSVICILVVTLLNVQTDQFFVCIGLLRIHLNRLQI